MRHLLRYLVIVAAATFVCLITVNAASAATIFTFTTGSPDGLMGAASQPPGANNNNVENETGDDFILTNPTVLTSATFTGLLPANFNPANINNVTVEIYRVFPQDSTNPPNGMVPTRVNSPGDVEFTDDNTGNNSLSFTTTVLNPNFTAANSVLNGIHPIPNQTTGGEGAITGQEVQFNVTFNTPISLPANHYFFVPQVGLTSGNFFWLSAPRPNVINPITPDLQAWTRNSALDPNWLRIGTDIVGGAATFNESFALVGTVVPEPATTCLALIGLGVIVGRKLRRR